MCEKELKEHMKNAEHNYTVAMREQINNSIPKEKIENLINSLKNDIVNTKIKMEKERYIDYIRKARLKAFNTKMNEIIDKLQELLEGGIK